MPRRRTSVRRRDWIKAAVTLLVIAAVIGYWWHREHPSTVNSTGMASATVVHTDRSGSELKLTVRYRVDGTGHETSGTVDAAQFRTDGRVVWVCFDPSAPSDTGQTRLRLPTDPLCDQTTSH